MLSIDVLICSFNKGVVKLDAVLLPPEEGVRYIVSYQYTDERYIDLMPKGIADRKDVIIHKYKGQGLSANRNQAMALATADIIMFADDDTRLSSDSFSIVRNTFEKHQDVDVAYFRATSYTGRLLKQYPEYEREIFVVPRDYTVSTIEKACRREKVQGVIRYDERFGLGTKFLTCGEEDVWVIDAIRRKLKLHYFPIELVETSMMLKQSMIYVDAGVQRSFGAFKYYVHGSAAWYHCFCYAFRSARNRYCHFFPVFRHMMEGVRYMRQTK